MPRESIWNNSDRIILFKQTLRDVQSRYYDIGAYGMLFLDFEEMCRKAGSEKINYLHFDINRDKKVYIVFSKKAKSQILNAFVKVKLFD